MAKSALSVFLTSSIGKKVVMGATGLFLVSFLAIHAYINAMIFYNDNGATFLSYAHFMGTNPIIRTMEIGLAAGILAHIVQGLMLWAQNKAKRPVGYKVNGSSKNTNWYSRSMGLLGTLILIFLILHWYHFWIPNRYAQFTTGHELNMYEAMQVIFKELWVVIIYTLGCISLAWHLIHGFWSAFQTFGLSTKKYKKLIRTIGIVYSVVINLVFIAMPWSMYLGCIK